MDCGTIRCMEDVHLLLSCLSSRKDIPMLLASCKFVVQWKTSLRITAFYMAEGILRGVQNIWYGNVC